MSNSFTLEEGFVDTISFYTPDGMDVHFRKADSKRLLRIIGTIDSIRYCELQGVLNPFIVSENPHNRELIKITLDETSRTEAEYGTVIMARMQFHFKDGGDPTTFMWRMTDDKHAISLQLVKLVDGKHSVEKTYISLR